MDTHTSAATDTAKRGLRPEIALSWRRSEVSGLDPETPNMRFEPDAARRRTRLLTAASPVLARLADHLSAAPYCVMLADRESRLMEDPIGSSALRGQLATVGSIAGGVFLEETTGTNAISTAHELRRGVVVHGDEHYLEPFKAFSCYGHPIIHPVTRRLEGVLDITCLSANSSPLLKPLVVQAVQDVEANLLEIGRRTERRLLAEFQVATSGHNRPVLGLAAGIVLASPQATELLSPTDHPHLTQLAAEMIGRRGRRLIERTETIELASGQVARARLRVVEPGLDAVIVEFHLDGSKYERRSAGSAQPMPVRIVARQQVYVGGAPGTGRTTTAHAVAGGSSIVELTGVGSDIGDVEWSALEEDLKSTPEAVLLVENIHLLTELDGVRLQSLLDSACAPAILTGAPLDSLTGQAAVLAAACTSHIKLPNLAERAAEIPKLVRTMLDQLGVVEQVRFSPAALAALSVQPWPGNLRELHSVVRFATERRSAGDITLSDLPDRYHHSQGRSLTALERAEFDAIVSALRASGGNKLRAAQELGISRTTLYSRLRSLRITL